MSELALDISPVEAAEYDVIFQAIPNTSQEIALDSRCDHTLLCGSRGGGKTITQLMHFRKNVGVGYGEFWRGVIFDREHKNLDDLVAQSRRMFPNFDDGASFKASKSEYRWVWPTGEVLKFCHVKKIEDYDNFHGHEYPWLGWNELTKQPTAELYDKMMSTNRCSFVPEIHTPKRVDQYGHIMKNEDGSIIYDTADGELLPPIPLQVFSTTNPSGVGHNWVKRRFINPAPYGKVVKKEIVAFNPKTGRDETYIATQIAIFSSYKENTFLDVKYIAELNSITAANDNLRKAWLEGSWDITAGGAVDDVWNSKVHIIPDFDIPSSWKIDRTFDWGAGHPFSVCWWAEASGEDATLPDGSTFCPAPGSLIQFAEWYGTVEIGTNKGLNLSPTNIAKGVKEREIQMLIDGLITDRPLPGPADNQIHNNMQEDVDSIAKQMEKNDVKWTKSDKRDGSRVNGLQLFRGMLEAAVDNSGEKAIYFCQSCPGSYETIPSLPRHKIKIEDVDTDSEDHVWDAVRYRVLDTVKQYATNISVRFVN